ncbi:MAG: hypothetical protein JST64_09325, partial [Actinobacteria bacterium]|nr:hypothetical protein [Actinomycetota bacterium]
CARFAGAVPFDVAGRPVESWWRNLAGDALILGAVAAVSPLGSLLVATAVALFAIGPWIGGAPRAGVRLAGAAMGGLVLSIPLQLPWLVESITRGDVASMTGLWASRAPMPSSMQMLTGSVGPIQTSWLGWGIVVAALVPILTGRSWRIGWAIAGWVLVLASVGGAAWLASAGMLGGAGAELLLVPAALGLATAVAMGPIAFEQDVVSGDFGIGQVASGVGIVALLVGLVPIAFAAPDGRWYQPDGDYQRALQLVDPGTTTRTLWIGDPDVLPVAGWTIEGGGHLALGVTEGSGATVTQRYRLDGGAGVARMRAAVEDALQGRTARLGRILAPMGIRYVLLIDRPAPEPFSPVEVPLPTGAVAAFDEQLDLVRIPVAPGAEMYEVGGVWPLRSDLTGTDVARSGASTAIAQLAISPTPPKPVLGRGPGTSFSGPLRAGAVVGQSVTADASWHLDSAGRAARRAPLLGWAQKFDGIKGGASTLAWSTPLRSRALQAIQVLALVLLVVEAGRRRRLSRSRPHRSIRRGPPVVVVTADGPAPTASADGPAPTASADEPASTARAEADGDVDDGLGAGTSAEATS